MDKALGTVFGFLFAVLFFAGVLINSVVLHTFRKRANLKTPTNYLIMGCVVCDLIMLVLGFPVVIVSGFCGKWIFGKVVCTLSAFVSTVISVTHVGILMAISIERYLVICRLTFSFNITVVKAYIALASCFGNGLVWAVLPLAGIGNYALDKNQLHCGPDWTNETMSVRYYNVSIFSMAFVCPLCILLCCYTYIYRKVRHNRVQVLNWRSRDQALQLNREINVAVSACLAVVSFLVAWSTYAALSLYSMHHSAADIPDWVTFLAPLLAKSACVWNPLVYTSRNNAFKAAIKSTVCVPQPSTANGTVFQ